MKKDLTKQKQPKKGAEQPAKKVVKPAETKAAKPPQKKAVAKSATPKQKDEAAKIAQKLAEDQAEVEGPEDQAMDDDDEEGYGQEDSEDNDFIAPEEEIEKEVRAAQKLQKLQGKKVEKPVRRRRPKEKGLEDSGVDDEDLELINENILAAKGAAGASGRRRLRPQVHDRDSSSEGVAVKPALGDDSSNGSPTRKAPAKPRAIKALDAEEQDEEASEARESDEEQVDDHGAQKDRSVTRPEDKFAFAEVFGHPNDIKIAERDVPERLQTKLGVDRLAPTDEQLVEEAAWIFGNIVEELSYNRNQDRFQDIKTRIFKVLRLFRHAKGDIPWICRYARADYAPELETKDVWRIFNLDVEYGKLQSQKQKITEFFESLEDYAKGDPLQIESIAHYKAQVKATQSLRDLNCFQSLMAFFRSYYQKEIEHKANVEAEKSSNGQKAPVPRRDFIFTARQRKMDQFSRKCMLAPVYLAYNLQAGKLLHSPNQPSNIGPLELAREYENTPGQEMMDVVRYMCEYTAAEIQSQPIVRQRFKQSVYECGVIRTEPTEKGSKELDVCHPCYRVKRVCKRLSELVSTDLFLEILQNDALGLITYTISCEGEGDADQVAQDKTNKSISSKYFKSVFEMFQPPNDTSQWQIPRREVFGILSGSFSSQRASKGVSFLQSIINEIKIELREDAESYVIRQSTKKYQDLIQKAYFKIDIKDKMHEEEIFEDDKKDKLQKQKALEDGKQIHKIPQRARLNVMGAQFTQIDSRTYQITVAIVDQYGDFVMSKDFCNLIPPREPKTNENGERASLRPAEIEEREKHSYDKEAFQAMLKEHQIDLIVVAADCLEAKKLKNAMKDLANLKNMNDGYEPYPPKEVHISWGRPEVPKLFAESHNSQKLLKGQPNSVKKVVSLARFEQDPMNEVLNLWSPIISENQALNLALHPLQKEVNQVKLVESLEEINVQTVNEVGIDINLLVEHEHWHNQLQFLSGLGPRKALLYIQRLKARRKPLLNRATIVTERILGGHCYGSSCGFTKVRVPSERRSPMHGRVDNMMSRRIDTSQIQCLDETRVHPQHYDTVYNLVADCLPCDPDQPQLAALSARERGKKIIDENIANVTKLDLIREQIKRIDQPGLRGLVDQTLGDLMLPFGDFRDKEDVDRSLDIKDDQEKDFIITGPTPNRLSTKELFYCLVDETERTFRPGMIVQATIVRNNAPGKLQCRLDNGLDAYIHEHDADEDQWRDLRRRDTEGTQVTGRLINFNRKNCEEDSFKSFTWNLICRRDRLCRHDKDLQDLDELGFQLQDVPEEDLINQNYAIEDQRANTMEQQPKALVPQRAQFVKRNIDHPRFKNIDSKAAIHLLKNADCGEYFFRPSSRGTNHLTCTWKFYDNIMNHLDIVEEGSRVAGSQIGPILRISDETFENLTEIVERYITPCNRSLREALSHQKFLKCKDLETLSDHLKKEKADDAQRIPYKITLMEAYPQYLVLGYVPKDTMVKEFIKVKPQGFFFHQKYFKAMPELLNWFKSSFRTPEYQRYLRKAGAPKASAFVPKVVVPDIYQQEQNAKMVDAQMTHQSYGYGGQEPRHESKHKTYGRVGSRGEADYRQAPNRGYNSRSRSREDGRQNNRYRDVSRSPNYKRNDSPRSNGSDRGYQSQRRERNFGRGSRPGGDRRDDDNRERKSCWNCNSTSHFARECPEPKKDNRMENRGARRTRDRSDSLDRDRPQAKRMRYDDDNGGGLSSFRIGSAMRDRYDQQEPMGTSHADVFGGDMPSNVPAYIPQQQQPAANHNQQPPRLLQPPRLPQPPQTHGGSYQS